MVTLADGDGAEQEHDMDVVDHGNDDLNVITPEEDSDAEPGRADADVLIDDDELDVTTPYADPDADPAVVQDEIDRVASETDEDESQNDSRQRRRPMRVRRPPLISTYDTLGGAPKLIPLQLPRK